MKKQKEYVTKIYSGTPEDCIFEFASVTKGIPKAIYWVKSPGFATIEELNE